MADQQFCLRWNNHQSTLVSVFDSLLERGCLVDCTLAAEGRSLQAHKVVLSACSPYLEELLSQHYDKHPILLLKDVKYEELQAMMDYMYRGEVNVAQDKLGHFLQAAESLQIKGLSDSGGKEPPDPRSTSVPSASKRTVKGIPLNRATLSESRKQANQEILLDGSSQDGSISPNIRKRRRRGASLADESDLNDSTGNAPVSHAPPPAAAPSATPSAPSKESLPLVPGTEASDPSFLTALLESNQTENNDSNSSSRDLVINQKHEPTSEILLEPKTEYVDDDQDLTMEDDMDNSLYKAGPSGRQSGYDGTQDSMDENFMSANESGARDAQDVKMLGAQPGWPDPHECPICGRLYKYRSTLYRHVRYECGGARMKLVCPICGRRFSRPDNLRQHAVTHSLPAPLLGGGGSTPLGGGGGSGSGSGTGSLN